jgi:hypothetical protein
MTNVFLIAIASGDEHAVEVPAVIREKLNRSAVLHSEAAPGNVAPAVPNRRDIVHAAKIPRTRAMYALFGGTGMPFGEEEQQVA